MILVIVSSPEFYSTPKCLRWITTTNLIVHKEQAHEQAAANEFARWQRKHVETCFNTFPFSAIEFIRWCKSDQ